MLLFTTALLVSSCTPSEKGSLFDKYFEPYTDLVSGQQLTDRNSALLDGMKAYGKGEYQNAIDLLSQYSSREPDIASPYFYMGICYLALDKPFDAELMFDHLDRIVPNNFKDQSEWYIALCLLNSGQNDRCLDQLVTILDHRAHAYSQEAEDLKEDLESNGQ